MNQQQSETAGSFNAAARDACLRSLRTLERAPDLRLGAVSAAAIRYFGTSKAGIGVPGIADNWFSKRFGRGAWTLSGTSAPARLVMLSEAPLVIPDLAADGRFAGDPLFRGDPPMRFFAGAPVFIEGAPAAALCLLDPAPRAFSPSEAEALQRLAGIAGRLAASRDQTKTLLTNISQSFPLGKAPQ